VGLHTLAGAATGREPPGSGDSIAVVRECSGAQAVEELPGIAADAGVYLHTASYVRRAMNKLFTNVDYWLETGIQVGPEEPEGWGKYPVVLPEDWESIEVERIWIRGRPASLTARHGAAGAELDWA